LYHELTSVDDAEDGDYIFPTSNAVIECPATYLRSIIIQKDEKISELNKTIDVYIHLLKFSQCYNHFGQNVVLRRLKESNPNDDVIRNWNYWKNCTQYLGNFDDRDQGQNRLQEQIYVIVREYGIDRNTWKAIYTLNNRRNDKVHDVAITEMDVQWLKDHASEYEQFENRPSRSNFVNAVTKLANALLSPNRQNPFAQPHQAAMTRYFNPTS